MSDFSTEIIREWVIGAHSDLEKTKATLAEHPGLLNVAFDWGQGSYEDALGAAAHVGNVPIAEFLLDQGAPLTITAAAMLGRLDDVRTFLNADSALANAKGAHGITLMFHAALSGNTALTNLLKERGCVEGYSHALHAAINRRDVRMVEWLLDHGVKDVNFADFRGRTPLAVAEDTGQSEIVDLLKSRGGTAE